MSDEPEDESQTFTFSLYATGVRDVNVKWAESTLSIFGLRNVMFVYVQPVAGSMAARYVVRVHRREPIPVQGWELWHVELQVESYTLGVRPVNVYVGEPTDWTSGMARFEMQDYGDTCWTSRPDQHGAHPGPVWVVCIRRDWPR